MSEAYGQDVSDPTRTDDQLTAEETELFERLAERYEGDVLGEIFELPLQSDSEEARA